MSRPPALWGQNVVDLRASAQIAHGLPRGWLPISAWARRIARDPLRCRANRRSSIEQRLLAEEIQRIHRGGRVEPKLPRFVLQVQYTRTVLVLFPTYSCIEAGHTGCQHGRHTDGTACTRATYSRVHKHTQNTHTQSQTSQTRTQRGPTKYRAGSHTHACRIPLGTGPLSQVKPPQSRPGCTPRLQPHRAWLRHDDACQRRCSRQRTVIFGTSLLHASLAPVEGDVSLVRSHSAMAVNS